MLKPVRILLFIALVSLQLPVHAGLVVNRSVVIFDEPALRSQDVLVRNQDGAEPLYLKIDVMSVERPGDNDERIFPADDLKPDFLASPNRMVVPPGEKGLLRLLNLDSTSDVERVYRVNIIPMAPPVDLAHPRDVVRSRLEVMLAYQVLVVILPKQPEAGVEVQRAGKTVTFLNSGNANYLLTGGVQCNPVEPSECISLESRRIYADTTWQMSLPFDGAFSYKVRTSKEIAERVFD